MALGSAGGTRPDSGSSKTVLLIGAIGLALSLAILRVRNLYEDEWLSLAFIQKPLGELWRWTLELGCHPPGALALDWLTLPLVGSARGVALIHVLVWYAAVAFFVLSAQRLLRTGWARAGFAVVAFMHPLQLMWAGSFRWYPVWWAVALAVLAAAFLRRRPGEPSWAATVALGLAVGALLYLDFLAIIFIPCFGVAWLVRYGLSWRSVGRVVALNAIGVLAALPVLSSLPDRSALHRCSAEVASHLRTALHMAHGLSISEAIMPWHPVAGIVTLGLMLPLGWLFVREFTRRWREERDTDPEGRRALAAMVCFLVLMTAAAIASGLGAKPRSFLGLATLTGLLLAVGAERVGSRRARALVTLLAVLWIGAGAYHLLARTGTAKRQLNDRPEQIIARLEQLAGHQPALVFTSNLILTFEINQRRAQGKTPLIVCSTWNDPVHRHRPGELMNGPPPPWVFVVEEAQDRTGGYDAAMGQALASARGLIRDTQNLTMGTDPDSEWKSRLVGQPVASYRFRIWYGRPGSGDWPWVGEKFALAARHSVLGDGD